MRSSKHLLGLPRGKHLFGTVKVGEKGQIVIPKEARELFGIQPGDTLLVLGDEENGVFISKPEVISEAANRVFEKLNESSRKKERTARNRTADADREGNTEQ